MSNPLDVLDAGAGIPVYGQVKPNFSKIWDVYRAAGHLARKCE